MIDLISRVRFHSNRCVATIAPNAQVSGLGAQMSCNVLINGLRQHDRENRIAIVLILLWTLPGNMAVRADEIWADRNPADENWQIESVNERQQNSSLLDGKRLFFNQKQREALERKADIFHDSRSSDLLSKEEAAGFVAEVEQQTSTVVAEPAEGTGTIYYHARIEGSEVIRVIVNGLPCEAVNRADVSELLSGTALDCKSIIAKRHQLLLLADGASIQIMDSGRLKGIITIGGSL